MRPRMFSLDMEPTWDVFLECHILVRDMNAREDRGGYIVEVGGQNH